MVEIKRVIITDIDIEKLNRLFIQQSLSIKKQVIVKGDLEQALCNSLFYLFVASDSERSDDYVGMATIFFQRNIARWIGEIHDVVVDEQMRGRGIGKILTRKLMHTAQEFCAERSMEMKLYLTSRPSRVEANALYAKLGFVLVAQSHGQWGTNLYKIIAGPTGFRGLP